MNDGNIRLRMTLKLNVGCLSLASEMNSGNIQLRMNEIWFHLAPFAAKKIGSLPLACSN